jgi:hypothetical protein
MMLRIDDDDDQKNHHPSPKMMAFCFPLSKLTGPILPATQKKKEKKVSVRGAPHYIEFVLAHATNPQLFAQSSQTPSFAQTKSLYTPFSLSLSVHCFLCVWLCTVCASAAISLVVRYHGQLANRLWVQLPPLSPTQPPTHSPNQLPTILTYINSVHSCQQVN